MRKAWRTLWGGMSGITSADSRSKAKYNTLRSALDADYRANYIEIEAHRAPEFDEWAEQDESNKCFGAEFLPTNGS